MPSRRGPLKSQLIFSDILEQGRQNDKRPGFVDSRDWFRQKASEARNINTVNLINKNPEKQRGAILPGYMYMFVYDAKHKDTLPYWDKFPLIFPFSVTEDHFMGINMHYLPLPYRAKLMDALYSVASNRKYDESTRLRISYDLLNSAAKYKYFVPCVKKYLKSQLKSRFLLIPSNEWDIALFLPLSRFQGARESTVFKDSLKIINKA
jgi:hypothetical protein